MIIRPYRHNDFEMICKWWMAIGEPAPLSGMMSEDGTFVLEHDGKASMSLTVLLTQTTIAYFEGYISAPGTEHPKSDGRALWDHCARYAKKLGHTQVIIYAAREKLVHRYQELGAIPVLTGLTGLVRSL